MRIGLEDLGVDCESPDQFPFGEASFECVCSSSFFLFRLAIGGGRTIPLGHGVVIFPDNQPFVLNRKQRFADHIRPSTSEDI
jgi:hypothetical protein